MKHSKSLIEYHIKDEQKAAKQYDKLGLPKFAKDERKHLRYWQKQKRH
jgi:hypothetical protein